MISSTEKSEAAIAHSANDMALFSIPPVLQRARCMTNGQLTPPSSPDHVQNSKAKLHTYAKRQGPQWIAGQRQKAEPMTADVNGGKLAGPGGVSGAAQKSSLDYHRTTASRPPASATIVNEHETYNQQPQTPSIELRRVLHSYDDLRKRAQEQEQEQEPTIPATSVIHTPLLPSPVIDENRKKFGHGASISSQLEGYKDTTYAGRRSAYQSYDEMQILSCYEDNHTVLDNIGVELGSVDTMLSTHLSPARSMVHEPFILSRQGVTAGPDHGFKSPESDWLANTTTHQQRLRRFKARCYQVVQHPFSISNSSAQEEGKVMLATLLVGPGKPKLVQIQRPPSSNSSSVHSRRSTMNAPARSGDTANVSIPAPPSTPLQQCKEISAFSPYDTPSVILSSNAPYVKEVDTITPVEQTPFTASKLHLVPRPLAISSRTSSDIDRNMFSARKNISPTKLQQQNQFYSSENSRTTSLPDLQFEVVKKNLDSIAVVVDDFPNNMTHLESPLLNSIRKDPTFPKNEAHVANLSKIFSNTPDEIISILAAWIIIDSYVSELCAQQEHHKPLSQLGPTPQHTLASTGQHHLIPKRSASLGKSMRGRRLRPSRTRQQQQEHRKPSVYRLFPFPATPQAVKSSSVSDGLTTSPPSLASSAASSCPPPSQATIPHKARYVLGITDRDTSDPSCSAHTCDNDRGPENLHLLTTHAKALSLSVSVVAQQLLQVLRVDGSGRGDSNCSDGWDAHLWRALGAVVDTVERM